MKLAQQLTNQALTINLEVLISPTSHVLGTLGAVVEQIYTTPKHANLFKLGRYLHPLSNREQLFSLYDAT